MLVPVTSFKKNKKAKNIVLYKGKVTYHLSSQYTHSVFRGFCIKAARMETSHRFITFVR